MDMDWARLGRAFAAARKQTRRTQVDVAEALDVSRSVIQAVERGTTFKKVSGTMRSYARLLGWTDGSIETVLAGGDPTSAAASEPAAPTPEGAAVQDGGLPLRIVDELSDEGSLLDTAVIPLTDDARMVVIVKGRRGASPDGIRRAVEAWRRTQPHLEALDEVVDEDGSPAPEA